MAKYNKATLTTRVNNLLPDNIIGTITPAVLRGVIIDLIDSLKAQDSYVEFDAKSANFPLTPANHEGTIDVTGNVTITFPDGFPEGWWCVVTNVGTGNINWTATNPFQSEGTDNNIKYTSFQVTHMGGDVWRIEGRLV